MIAHLEQFVNTINKPKNWLILANVLLVFFLILLSNLGVLPLHLEDFVFFTFLVLALALYRPGWAFLFFIGTIALENINLAPPQLGMMLRPYQFIGALTMLALVIRFFSRRLNFSLPKFKKFDALIALIILGSFLSVLNAPDKPASLKLSVIIFSFAILYLLTRIYIQSFDDLKRIIPFFLSSSIVVILYGIWQNIRFIYGGLSFETMPGRPNATFAEADWLGIYLVLALAIIYAILSYCHSERSEESHQKISNSEFLISNQIPNAKYQMLNTSIYILLTTLYIILILTVSRSAWLGAFAVTFIFLFIIFTDLKFNFKNWQFKEFFKILRNLAGAIICSILIIYVFHLTNFQLFNRVQSTGGLQKITIACIKQNCNPAEGGAYCDMIKCPDIIENVGELKYCGCRFINLEDIESEKAAGNEIREIYRKDPNVNIRQQIYQKSWQQIKNNWLLGIGWGSIGKILGSDERGEALNSSNIFLEVWLGAGIIGLLAFICIWIWIFLAGIKNFKNGNRTYGLFLLLGSLALLIPNLFNAGIMLGILWIFWGVSQIKNI